MRLAAWILLLAHVALAASGDAVTVGVLRRDGVIIPFATFDGKRWSARWPPPATEQTVPITLESVPKRWWGEPGLRDTWQAWLTTPRETPPIKVLRPDVIDVHCTRQIGLRTDYRPAELPPPDAQPYPKDGLVVSPPRDVARIEILERSALELLPLRKTLTDAFNRAERLTASRGP